MINKAFVLAAGTAMFALPFIAHSQSYGQQSPATTSAPASGANASQADDSNKAKTSEDSADSETVIRAGPNAGQVINRHRRSKDMTKDATKPPPKDSQCEQPCV